jgi:SAM-dependent methyltransferase
VTRYTAADLYPEAFPTFTEGEIVRADITVQPFADGSFDKIIVSHVLEHIPDDLAAMREMKRTLAPGGLVISQHPFDPDLEITDEDPSVTTPEERLRRFKQADHVRVYGHDLLDRWRSVGFTLEVLGDEMPGNTIVTAMHPMTSASPARNIT